MEARVLCIAAAKPPLQCGYLEKGRSMGVHFFPLFLGRTLATECPIEFLRDILILTSGDQDSITSKLWNQFNRFVPKHQRLLFGLDKQAGTGGSSSGYHSNSEANLPITG